jgi:glycosyltransferase involved in cell wall biosynthesis
MKLSVIIATYNQPEWLEKVIMGYSCQSITGFEIIIADDGSKLKTADKIRALKEKTGLNIQHVWHPDDGFQKNKIVNMAIASSQGDYLIFTDGDLIPREDFLESHSRFAKQGYFLSGGCVRLTEKVSHLIEIEDIISQNAFSPKWLINKGQPFSFRLLKLTRSKILSTFLNLLTPAGATWNGGNTSAFKSDLLAVNGYDERLRYGGEDRELGERLVNLGLKGKQLRYTLALIHLEHPRGYKDEAAIKANKQLRKETKQQNSTWTAYGIIK